MRGIEAAFTARLGGDPEEKVSAKGTVWCSFRVVVDGGEESTWVRVASFGDLAQRCCADLKKGSKVYLEGALRQATWQDKATGEQRHGLELAAWHVTPLGPGKNKPERPSNGEAQRDWQRPPQGV